MKKPLETPEEAKARKAKQIQEGTEFIKQREKMAALIMQGQNKSPEREREQAAAQITPTEQEQPKIQEPIAQAVEKKTQELLGKEPAVLNLN